MTKHFKVVHKEHVYCIIYNTTRLSSSPKFFQKRKMFFFVSNLCKARILLLNYAGNKSGSLFFLKLFLKCKRIVGGKDTQCLKELQKTLTSCVTASKKHQYIQVVYQLVKFLFYRHII